MNPTNKLKKILPLVLSMSSIFATNQVLADDVKWRTVKPENMVIMSLPHGDVVFELSSEFSPNHVKQFKALAKAGLYKDNKFYRVIDGFVAQSGPDEKTAEKYDIKTLKIEEDRAIDTKWQYTLVQNNDLFAAKTGFKNGFAVGVDEGNEKAWLTHCPGVLAMARGNEPDTAGSHFYITNGQAPRYLDRIMTVFGRVIYGMDNVQAIKRTAVVAGDDDVPAEVYTPILSMQVMSDLPKEQQWEIEVEDTESAQFAKKLDDRRKRDNAFFYKKPPPVLDVCQVPVVSKLVHRPK